MFEVLKIENEKIVSHSIVNREPREGEVVVNNWQGTVGEPITYYDENYKRYTDIELINKGLKELPKGLKIEDNKLVEMTLQEKYEAGLITLHPTQKIVDNYIVEKTQAERINEGIEELPPQFKKENGEIVPKTMEEMFADGTITQSEYNEYIILTYKQFLDSTDWVVIKTIELQMKGEEISHDYSDILKQREQARKEINKREELNVCQEK